MLYIFNVMQAGQLIGTIRANSLDNAKSLAHTIYQIGTEPITLIIQ